MITFSLFKLKRFGDKRLDFTSVQNVYYMRLSFGCHLSDALSRDPIINLNYKLKRLAF